jgi:hypothetical protein
LVFSGAAEYVSRLAANEDEIPDVITADIKLYGKDDGDIICGGAGLADSSGLRSSADNGSGLDVSLLSCWRLNSCGFGPTLMNTEGELYKHVGCFMAK